MATELSEKVRWAADELNYVVNPAGERCMAISVVVAVGDAGDKLIDALATRTAALKVRDGMEHGAEMGPVVSSAAKQRIEKLSGEVLKGHVESISRGIYDRDNPVSRELVADVNPTFNWVQIGRASCRERV